MNNFGYKKLIVWQKSVLLLQQVYALSGQLPRSEQFNMISQMNRAAVSVMLNIAEGSARRTLAERKRFYEISRSSAIEIDSLFEGECRIEFFDGSCV